MLSFSVWDKGGASASLPHFPHRAEKYCPDLSIMGPLSDLACTLVQWVSTLAACQVHQNLKKKKVCIAPTGAYQTLKVIESPPT